MITKIDSYFSDEEFEKRRKLYVTDYQKKRLENQIAICWVGIGQIEDFKPKGNPIFDKFAEIFKGNPVQLFNGLEACFKCTGQLRRYRVVRPTHKGKKISISTSVTVEDLTYNERRTLNIVGEGVCYGDRSEIPFSSPLATFLLGAKTGDVRAGCINGRLINYKIASISEYKPQE